MTSPLVFTVHALRAAQFRMGSGHLHYGLGKTWGTIRKVRVTGFCKRALRMQTCKGSWHLVCGTETAKNSERTVLGFCCQLLGSRAHPFINLYNESQNDHTHISVFENELPNCTGHLLYRASQQGSSFTIRAPSQFTFCEHHLHKKSLGIKFQLHAHLFTLKNCFRIINVTISGLIVKIPYTGNLFSLNFRNWFGSGSAVVRTWLGCGSDVVWMWFGCGSDVFSDVLQTVWQCIEACYADLRQNFLWERSRGVSGVLLYKWQAELVWPRAKGRSLISLLILAVGLTTFRAPILSTCCFGSSKSQSAYVPVNQYPSNSGGEATRPNLTLQSLVEAQPTCCSVVRGESGIVSDRVWCRRDVVVLTKWQVQVNDNQHCTIIHYGVRNMILDVTWSPWALRDACSMKLTFGDVTLILCLAARAHFVRKEEQRRLEEQQRQREVAIIVMWLCACSICSLSSCSIAWCAPKWLQTDLGSGGIE